MRGYIWISCPIVTAVAIAAVVVDVSVSHNENRPIDAAMPYSNRRWCVVSRLAVITTNHRDTDWATWYSLTHQVLFISASLRK